MLIKDGCTNRVYNIKTDSLAKCKRKPRNLIVYRLDYSFLMDIVCNNCLLEIQEKIVKNSGEVLCVKMVNTVN